MQRVLPIALISMLACVPAEPTHRAEIRLEVTDGRFAGRYAVRTDDPVCADRLLGAGTLGVRYTDLDSAAPLASLQVVIEPDSAFYLGVVFGGFRSGDTEHVIETRASREPQGHGAATLDHHAESTVLHIAGRTGDGIPLTARVRCAAADSTL